MGSMTNKIEKLSNKGAVPEQTKCINPQQENCAKAFTAVMTKTKGKKGNKGFITELN